MAYGQTIIYIMNFLVITIMNLQLYLLVRRLYEIKGKNTILGLVFGVITSIVTIFANDYVHNEPFTYICVFLTIAILLFLLLRLHLQDALIIALFEVFHLMVFKGIVVGMVSLILVKNMYQILLVPEYAKLVNLASSCLLLLAIIGYSNAVKTERFAAFRRTPGQKYFVLITQLALSLFMLFYSYNYYYNMEMVWFSVAQILTSVIMLGAYDICFYYGIRVSIMVNIELKNKQRSEQMSSQLAQYRNYQAYAKQISQVKHDFSEMTLSVDYLLKENKTTEAMEALSIGSKKIGEEFPEVVKYSNNELLDALLYEAAGQAKKDGIEFAARMYVPDKLRMSDKDLHAVVSDLVKNALEAANKINGDRKKFITIESSAKKNWLTIRFSNSFAGTVKVNNGLVTSKKANKDLEGQGLLNVRALVEKSGGMLNINVDQQNHIFSASVHIYSASAQ